MSAEEVQRERERQRDFQREQQELQAAFNQNDGIPPSAIEQLLSSDDVREGDAEDLQQVTLAKIKSLLGQDTLLANYTTAQENDIRFKLEVIKMKVLSSHPPEESVISGELRAFLWDDPMEELQPLTAQERIIIDDLFETLKSRVTRGREGFERKQINTRIAKSESETKNDSNNSGWSGLFG